MAPGKNRASQAQKLRVIGGRWRGRKLSFAAQPGLRPTADRVRETLFNWLSPVISGSRCLDLFSGSGALGIEALSRGASFCTFLDTSPEVTRMLRLHLQTLDCQSAEVLQQDALRWLKTRPEIQPPYSIVFIDPPFHEGLVSACVRQLTASGWLDDNACVYIESERELTLETRAGWTLHRQKQAGNVRYSLYTFEHS